VYNFLSVTVSMQRYADDLHGQLKVTGHRVTTWFGNYCKFTV